MHQNYLFITHGQLIVEPTDRDLVVVVDAHQVAQLEMSGQGGRFTSDSLHGASVTKEAKCPVVDQVVPGFVEHACDVCLRNRQPNGIRKTLAQRTCRDFDPRCLEGFRVSWCLAVQLLGSILAAI